MVALLVEVFFVAAFLVEVTLEVGQGKPRSHTTQNLVRQTFSTTVPKKTGNTGGLSLVVVNEAVSQENWKERAKKEESHEEVTRWDVSRSHSGRRPLP